MKEEIAGEKMSFKYKGNQKFLLIIVLFFAFIFFIGYQGNLGSIAPPPKTQFANVPNKLCTLEKFYTWADNGSVVCNFGQIQSGPVLISDGVGGAIIVWMDARGIPGGDLYAQRIDASGNMVWSPSTGVPVCTVINAQTSPLICSDGQGGAIIVWNDFRTEIDIYAQRLNATGQRQWGTNGIPICNYPTEQYPSAIISDGAGGAIITWTDYRKGTSNKDIYAQRVNINGVPQWPLNGTPICSEGGNQANSKLCSDMGNGAIICWEDQRSGNLDIYAQGILSSGTPAWTPNETKICTFSGDQKSPTICKDGSGGAVIVWSGGPGGVKDIYAQRINSAGSIQWIGNGTVISNAINDQDAPQITPDTLGGFIIAWRDYRKSNYDIFAQRINSSGKSYWAINGTPICMLSSSQGSIRICSDGHGGAFITWQNMDFYDIYAQLVNYLGQCQYQTNGTVVCNAPNSQSNPNIINDGTDNAIIVWQDERAGSSDPNIYAQKLKYVDKTGPIMPIISSTTHPNQNNWYFGNTVTVQWTTPADVSGVYNYLYRYDQIPTTIPILGDTQTNVNTASFTIPTDGTWYFHVRGNDTLGNLGDTGHFKLNIDRSPPQGSNPRPANLGFTNSSKPNIALNLNDSLSGINVLAIQMLVNSTSVPCTWNGVTVNWTATNPYSNGATVNVQLNAQDNAGNAMAPYTWSFRVDLAPPTAFSPQPLAFTNKSKPNIALTIIDSLSGTKGSSIQMQVNGSPVIPSWNGGVANWTATSAYFNGDTVNVRVTAQDDAGNSMAPYIWSFRVDTVLPTASNPRPKNLAFTNKSQPNIALDLTDSLSGINAGSIKMWVNGSIKIPTWNGVTVNWTPSSPYTSGTLVNVQVNAQDNAGNNLVPFTWFFRIDSKPPILGGITDPPYRGNISGPGVSISIVSADDVGGSGVAFVELYDGLPPTKLIWNSTTSFFMWNTIPETPGLHYIYLRVYDYARNMFQNATGWPVYIDNTPPIKACITSPRYNANLTGSVTITTTVLDNVNGTGIHFVEFYDNGGFLASSWWPPYQYSWTPIEGLHNLTIHAIDWAGLMFNNATGVPIHIDNTNPTLARITAPVYNANITMSIIPHYLTVTAIAADNDGGTGIQRVEFYDNAILRGTDYFRPYESGYIPSEGLHNLTVRAYDFTGHSLNNATIIPIHIDNTPPSIASIIAPPNNTYMHGIIVIQANAADALSGVMNVTFWLDAIGTGTLLGTVKGAGPYNLAWNTSTVGDGARNLYIRVFDYAGNYRDSNNTRVTVDNTPPGIAIESVLPNPSNGLTTIRVTNTTADFDANGVRANVSTPAGWIYPVMTYNTGLARWIGTFTVTATGTYTVRINATDKAGNKAYAGPASITGDITPPGITLSNVFPDPSDGLTTITVTNTTADFNANGILANVSRPDKTWFYPIMTYTGENTWIGTFMVTQNGNYTVRINASDKAGNKAYAGPRIITGSISGPSITLQTVLPNPSNGLTTITATNASANINANGIRANISTPSGGWLYRNLVYIGANSWTTTFIVTANGVYTVLINGTSKTGWTTYDGPVSITGDIVPPGITLTSVLPMLSNGLTTITVTNSTKDNPPNGIKANVSTPSGGWLYPTMTYAGLNQWIGSFTVTANGSYTIRVNATDFAGNKAYAGPMSITGDITPPGITFTNVLPMLSNGLTTITVTNSTADTNANGIMANVSTPSSTWLYPVMMYQGGNIWRGTFTVTSNGVYAVRVNATDKAGNKAYAGPTSITGDITSPGIILTNVAPNPSNGATVITVTNTTADTNANGVLANVSTPSGNWLYPTMIYQGSNQWRGTFLVTANGAYTVRVNATDKAGNKAYAGPTSITGDITPPGITLTSFSPNPCNGWATITVTNTTADFNANGVMANVSTPMGNYIYRFMTYQGGNIWQSTFWVAANGVYTVRVNATDKAGNNAYAGSMSIIGDITPPGITLTSVLPILSNGLTTITVTNSTADTNANGIRANVSTPSSTWLYPIMTYQGGNTWQGTFTVTANGPYIVWVNATDMAGNKGYAGPITITGDVIPPGIMIASVLPNPSSGVTTINAINITADINANGIRANVSTPMGIWLSPNMSYTGGSIWTGTFTVIMNGTYTVRINATDKAGNKAYAGPSSITGLIYGPSIALVSVLPNPSRALTTIIATNGTVLNAFGIRANVSTPSGGWLYPTMTYIGANTWMGTFTVTANGAYTVRINGTDKLGYKAYARSTSIMGDITPPVASNPNPANLTSTKNSKSNIALDLIDSLSGINSSSIQMKVNGIPVAFSWNGVTVSWTPSEPYENGKTVMVEVDVQDNAGNKMTTYTWSFTVELPVTPETPGTNWIIYIFIAIGAIAGIGITVFYVRSRKPAMRGPTPKPKWIAGMEASFPADMVLEDKIDMIISKGIPFEDIADPEIKKLVETPMGGLSLDLLEKLRKLPIPVEELPQILAELSSLSPEDQSKFLDDLATLSQN